MALTSNSDFSEVIEGAIKRAVTEKVSALFDTKKQEVIAEMERIKNEVVAGVVLNVMEQVSYEYFGRDLRIIIKKLDSPTKGN